MLSSSNFAPPTVVFLDGAWKNENLAREEHVVDKARLGGVLALELFGVGQVETSLLPM